jgi:chromosome segregation ATPase
MSDISTAGRSEVALRAARKHNAYQHLLTFVTRLKGLTDVLPDLQNLASLENAQAEALTKLEEIRAAIEQAKAEDASRIAAAEAAAAKIRSDAQAEAGRMLAEARAEADAVNSAAEARRIELRGVMDELAAKQSELASVSAAVAEATALHGHFEGHAALAAEIANKEERLRALNATIARLRSQFGGQ